MESIINPASQIQAKHYNENEKISVVTESLDPEGMPMIDDQGRKNSNRPPLQVPNNLAV